MLNCTCEAAGYCQRHKREKTDAEVARCKTSDHWRALWDRQAESGERTVCTRWEPVPLGFRCVDCQREHSAENREPPVGRPCVPPQHLRPAGSPGSEVPQKSGCCGQGTPALPQPSVAPAIATPVKGPELPPLSERLRNLAVSAGDFMRDPKLCTADEVLARLKVCDEPCPKLNGHFCSVCGCWLASATKLKSKHCPMGKWPGDDKGWRPLVHDNWLAGTMAAVIHYGDVELTHMCVADCLRELPRVLVIDNNGNYTPISNGKETVFAPERNVGWGGACNIAIERALADSGVMGIAILNNDVRLSAHFFSGLIVAQQVSGASIVAPVYSSGWPPQRPESGYAGQADAYQPRPSHRPTGYCDGTAVLFTREVLAQCGGLDLEFSPRFGWGLIMDYCVRAKDAGHTVAITEASYALHHGMQAAGKVFGVGEYVTGARAEMEEGRKRKYGDRWGWLLESHSLRPPITKRNLIYHISPFADNDVWLRNVKQLLKRIDLFNGKRVVAISTGERMLDAKTVCAAFGGQQIDFLFLPNDQRLRERATADLLLDAVYSTDPNTATFYAHAKGVATAGNVQGVTYWRNAMYHELLDDWPRISDTLRTKSCAGTHRLSKGVYPDGLTTNSWHYAGTFWWFRHDALFAQKDWRQRLPDSGWGMEAYPGIMFAYNDAGCVFMDEPANSYDPNTYVNPIEDDAMPPVATSALKVELGGGRTPRGDGYVNVDRLPCADVQCDFDRSDAQLPFEDNSVVDLYTSHCLEHIEHLGQLMREIVRVCRVGARVEIRVPHWQSNMAMCHGHRQTITHEQVDHWTRSAIDFWWGGLPKRLKHFSTDYAKGGSFDEWRGMLPTATDDQILRLCPDACHEARYVFHVIENK